MIRAFRAAFSEKIRYIMVGNKRLGDFLSRRQTEFWALWHVYCLYFAKSKQRTKNSNSKKFSGKVIKIYESGDDFYRVLNSVIPFCLKRTGVAPFITEKR